MADTSTTKLLDNRWMILLMKQVDGRYCAAAKKPYRETWLDIFGIVNDKGENIDPSHKDFLGPDTHPKKPHRITNGVTPEEALMKLADRVLGLAK